MFRTKLLLSVTILFVLTVSLAVSVEASSTTWSKTYGGTSNEWANSVIATSDGGYAIAGYTLSFGAGNYDYWLVKTDADGNLEWSQTYGGTGHDEAHAVIETSDGGYAIAGGSGNEFWLVKTDADGTMEWDRTYGGDQGDFAYSLVETSDDGYAIVGITNSFGAGNADFWLVKTDELGNEEWSRTYGGTGTEAAYSVIEVDDGGYAIAGKTTDSYLLVKTDSSGNEEWNKEYKRVIPAVDYPLSPCALVATSDEGYAIAGCTALFDSGGDCYLIKTDGLGNIEWNQTYGGPDWDWATSLVETADGGYAIGGNTNSSGAGSFDFLLIKTDRYGSMEWKKTYGGENVDRAYSVVETFDRRYAIAGFTMSFGTGGMDFWLVKTDGCMKTDEYDTYEFDYDFGYFTYTVVVWTNSTLGNFDFGLDENQISFSVAGPDGTSGFCRIAIPEELVGGDFPVYLSETLLVEGVDYTRTYNGTHTILDITYSHSTHTIEITGTKIIPEYSTLIVPTLVLAATLFVVVYKKRLRN